MVLARLPLAPVPLLGRPDWSGVGLVLAIVGSFLLANSILFRHPRELLSERFGKRTQDLHSIREYIFHRVQVNLGFGFLLAGFLLQLYGHYRPVPPDADTGLAIVWIGIVVLLGGVLLLAGWWWSLLAFRRYVVEYLREHSVDLGVDVRLAREIGELFGVESLPDETVQSYLARLSRRLGPDLAPSGSRALRPLAAAPEDEEV